MVTLVERLRPASRNACAVAAAVLGLGVSAVALYATALLVITSARMQSVSIQPSATPLFFPQVILPLGFLLLALAYLDEILRRVTGRRPGAPPSAGIEYL